MVLVTIILTIINIITNTCCSHIWVLFSLKRTRIASDPIKINPTTHLLNLKLAHQGSIITPCWWKLSTILKKLTTTTITSPMWKLWRPRSLLILITLLSYKLTWTAKRFCLYSYHYDIIYTSLWYIYLYVHGSWLIQIGAPPEVVDRITAARKDFEARQQRSTPSVPASSRDPELDQFMVNY